MYQEEGEAGIQRGGGRWFYECGDAASKCVFTSGDVGTGIGSFKRWDAGSKCIFTSRDTERGTDSFKIVGCIVKICLY